MNLVASSCYIDSGQNGVLPGRSSSQNRGGLAPQKASGSAWTWKSRGRRTGPTGAFEQDVAFSRHFSPMGPQKAALFGIKRFE